MRGSARRLFVVATAFALAGTLAGAPAQASRRSCLTQADKGKTVAESRSSVAWSRRGTLHACVYSADHAVVLPQQGRFRIEGQNGTADIDSRLVRLAGRYVAYSSKWTADSDSAHSTIRQRVYVYDARFPDLKNRSDEHGDGAVDALVLKHNGSAAWTFTSFPGSALPDTITYVYKMDTTGDGEQQLDESRTFGDPPHYTIDAGSLALSANGLRLFWTRDPDGPQTAAIR
jgi:hypothetical protein